MSKTPSVSGKDAVSALKRHGFEEARTTGSHVILKREGHRFLVTVPCHGNRSLKKGTLRGILKAAGLTIEQLLE